MSLEQRSTAEGRESSSGVPRRSLIVAGAGAATLALSGCLGGGGGGSDGDVPAAITIPEGATCDVCGMTIRQHPGPTTEIFYADQQPNGHDNPARFDSTWEAYQFEFERDEQGWADVAFYVTDYSAVDYEVFEEGGDTLISRHYEASAFAPASEVTYVVDSEVKGTMGRDLVAFTDRGDAESFRADHGGSLTTHDGVTPEVIGGLGK